MNKQIGEPSFKGERNLTIEKSSFGANKIFVNDSLCFENVNPNIWEYKIGGYQVLDKYLKSHKGEEIDFRHFQRIIQTLERSLKIEAQIAQIEIQ